MCCMLFFLLAISEWTFFLHRSFCVLLLAQLQGLQIHIWGYSVVRAGWTKVTSDRRFHSYSAVLRLGKMLKMWKCTTDRDDIYILQLCVCVCSRVSRRLITNVWESFPACITGTKPLFCIKHVRGRTLPCACVKAHYINFALYVQVCVHNSVKMQFHISKSAQLITLAWIAGILLDNIL